MIREVTVYIDDEDIEKVRLTQRVMKHNHGISLKNRDAACAEDVEPVDWEPYDKNMQSLGLKLAATIMNREFYAEIEKGEESADQSG